MNSPAQPPVSEAPSEEHEAQISTVKTEDKPEIATFKFPFKPSQFAQAKSNHQPWYKNGVTNGHTKTPGAAPPGTRRAMGKR